MTTVLQIIAETLWYFLPALIANTAPVFAAAGNWLSFLNIPLDGGFVWHGQPLLGSRKTVRGVVVGIFFGSSIGFLQFILQDTLVGSLQLFTVTHSLASAAAWGALLGVAALGGDAIKSFCKRRRKIPVGIMWMPWDQIDIVLGTLVVTQWFAPLPLSHIITAFIVIGCGMFVTSFLGVTTGIKKSL